MILLAGMLALQIIAGLFAIGFTAVFCIIAYWVAANFDRYDKYVSLKLKNHALGLKLQEAQKNGIVTLKNILLSRKARYKEGVDNHNKMGGHITELESLVKASCAEDDPYYEQNVKDLERTKKGYEFSKQRILAAKKAIEDFEKRIQHSENRAKIAKVAKMAMAGLQDSDIEETLSMEAFSSIDVAFGESMVALENAVEFGV